MIFRFGLAGKEDSRLHLQLAKSIKKQVICFRTQGPLVLCPRRSTVGCG